MEYGVCEYTVYRLDCHWEWGVGSGKWEVGKEPPNRKKVKKQLGKGINSSLSEYTFDPTCSHPSLSLSLSGQPCWGFVRRVFLRPPPASLSLSLSLSPLGLEGRTSSAKMQGVQTLSLHASMMKNAVLKHIRLANPRLVAFSRFKSVSSARIDEQGFESTTIADILKAKGKGADGSWLWCATEDTVYDAVKSMTQHNVGALVVVRPGEQKSIAGIITERDYLRKIIVQGRSSKSTKVGDIMTEENNLITVTPDTRVLKAMQLMTDNRIRHIPVISDGLMIGMVSIGDVVRAVVSEHREELDRLNAYIQGGY